jgi:hypothetical protein
MHYVGPGCDNALDLQMFKSEKRKIGVFIFSNCLMADNFRPDYKPKPGL